MSLPWNRNLLIPEEGRRVPEFMYVSNKYVSSKGNMQAKF